MAVYGHLSILDNRIPSGIDAALLETLRRESGLSQEQAVAQAADIIGIKNEQLAAKYGGLLSFTSERSVEYRASSGSARYATPISTEIARNPSLRGENSGHMLPRQDFDTGIDYDFNFARRGSLTVWVRACEEVAESWENRVDFDIIRRALVSTEDAVGAGFSVGWAIGSGTNINFVPPQYRGRIFTSSHSHYLAYDTSAGRSWTDAIVGAMQELRHHGHAGMLTLMVGEDNVDEVSGATGFVELEYPQFVVNTANTNAPVRFLANQAASEAQGIPGELFGYFKSRGYGTAEVRYHPRIPGGYGWVTKSYGVDNPRNGLRVYVENPLGFGLDIEPDYRVTPENRLNRVRVFATHGVGVGADRTNGCAFKIGPAVSAYTNPIIS